MRLALPLALLLASCGAAPPPTSSSSADCARDPQAPVERVTAASDLRPRPPPRAPGEPLEIPRDWRALPGTPILWRGPRVRHVLVADARTIVAVGDGCITVLSGDDGTVLWSVPRPQIDRFRGHVIGGAGHVVLGTPRGLQARHATTGAIAWEIDIADDDAWLDEPSVDGRVLTTQVERNGAASTWHVDLASGRVTSREACEHDCPSRRASRVLVRPTGDGAWEGRDLRNDRVLWSRPLGFGRALAELDDATLVVTGGVIRRVSHHDGNIEWEVPLPRESLETALSAASTVQGATLLLALGGPSWLLARIDVDDGAVLGIQTLEVRPMQLAALDEHRTLLLDSLGRLVAIDLEHVVASARETISLEEDIARLTRVIAEGGDRYVDARVAQAITTLARLDAPETAPEVARALRSLPLHRAVHLAVALGRTREPTTRRAMLDLLEHTDREFGNAAGLLARARLADAIVFPLDEPEAMREVAAFEALLRSGARESARDAWSDALRATRNLVERTSRSGASLRALRAAFGSSPPTCALADRDAIELAILQHEFELSENTIWPGTPHVCVEPRSIGGAVEQAPIAACVLSVERDEPGADALWPEAPHATASRACTRGSLEVFGLSFVDGLWRVVDSRRLEF